MELKKNPEADISNKAGLFINMGMAISLFIVTVGFEWRTYDDSGLLDLGDVEADFEDILDIPITEIPPPPPPKIKIPEIIEIPDEEEIEEEIEVELDVEVTEETEVAEIIFDEAPEEEVADQIFQIVEEPATFPGGLKGFAKYLRKNLKYPRQAQRMGIEGRVFVQFVVEKDGSLTDIKVVKGIGAGCDEEAEKVIRNTPNWKPGKQRGKPVRQRMIQSIVFKFQN